MKKTLSERRQSNRVELNRIVIVKNASEIKKLVGINYSTGGIAVNSSKPLSVGEEFDLLFWLTEPESQEIKVPGIEVLAGLDTRTNGADVVADMRRARRGNTG